MIEALWHVTARTDTQPATSGRLVLAGGVVAGADTQKSYLGSYKVDSDGTITADVEIVTPATADISLGVNGASKRLIKFSGRADARFMEWRSAEAVGSHQAVQLSLER